MDRPVISPPPIFLPPPSSPLDAERVCTALFQRAASTKKKDRRAAWPVSFLGIPPLPPVVSMHYAFDGGGFNERRKRDEKRVAR